MNNVVPHNTAPDPQLTASRVVELDALRAFTLLGILCVNIWFFADPFVMTGNSNPDFQSAQDVAVRFAVSVFFEAKFYILFSFLFGYSFVLQWASAVSAGQSEVPRTLRRAAGLVIIGLFHGLFLFHGDILLTYGLVGLVLLGTRMISARAAAVAAGILIGAMGLIILLLGLLTAAVEPTLGEADLQTLPPAFDLAGSPAAVLAQNISLYPMTLVNALFLQGPIALGAFYAGLACAKNRLIEQGLSRRTLMMVVCIALPIGLAAALLQGYLVKYVGGIGLQVVGLGISTLTGPLLTAGYVGLLLLLFRTRLGRAVRNALAPAGQLALSNYLGQSVLMLLLFTGFGLSLTDQVPPLGVLGIAALIFLAQLLLSYWWVRKFRYGPMEALLRAATYWRKPTLGSAPKYSSQ
ncbi:DUF418 domain-containing protein [Arthrobacter crystallopoietes]|uniref:DUF418 domain-containing protein n=1 Tax=Crystallibacter crystallopoietes TaxID=37928 RepID=A0A1H1CP67_9MICC|nr:DUF418 domain-containing protein [Arthrobacter crystallopoietes]AUI50656.1 hypothetical protein AC20117_07265 [Arthrobacter crystallopoietes]SDQ66045.1 uncharacterized protein SAMN04489742_2024 [Arthrobacter crystallopoietes]